MFQDSKLLAAVVGFCILVVVVVVCVFGAVIMTGIAMLIIAGFSYLFYWRKINGSIDLIEAYANREIKSLSSSPMDIENMRKVIDIIEKGNPHGEPKQDYTPVMAVTPQDDLSFDQIRDAFRYLKKRGDREILLGYFSTRSTAQHLMVHINTDYVRSFTQQRKIVLWELLITRSEELLKIAKELTLKLKERRENRNRLTRFFLEFP